MKALAIFVLLILIGGCKAAEPEVYETYQEALSSSKKSGRLMFIYFSGKVCPPCTKMELETLSSKEGKMLLQPYILCKIITDDNRPLAEKYGVTSVPSYFIVTSDEKITNFGVGYKTPPDFKIWIGK